MYVCLVVVIYIHVVLDRVANIRQSSKRPCMYVCIVCAFVCELPVVVARCIHIIMYTHVHRYLHTYVCMATTSKYIYIYNDEMKKKEKRNEHAQIVLYIDRIGTDKERALAGRRT